MFTRREVLGGAAATVSSILAPAELGAAKKPLVRMGAMDGIFRKTPRLERVAVAAKLGFDGIEVNIGRPQAGDTQLQLADPAMQANYLSEAKKHKIVISGVVLDALHVNYLKNDKQGQKWVADGIEIARKLNAGVLLLPFFGKGALQTKAEMDYVADVLKAFVGQAKKARIRLALENTISAEDNARILDRIGSSSAGVYYDVGNSTNSGGFDSPKEIRFLGKDRLCQIHFKDRGYLGEGKVNMPEVVRAMKEIGYRGFAVLETSSPSGDAEADAKRNLEYSRDLLKKEGLG